MSAALYAASARKKSGIWTRADSMDLLRCMDEVTIRAFTPADTDWLVEQHQALYAVDEGFDDTFGPLVRDILTKFCAERNPSCEAGWIAEHAGRPLGSIFCVRHDAETAKLRLFLLVPEARGFGLGQALLDTCTGFAQRVGYRGMTLWTHESHRAACALYEKNGWVLTEAVKVRSFGQDLVEQTWTLEFQTPKSSRDGG